MFNATEHPFNKVVPVFISIMAGINSYFLTSLSFLLAEDLKQKNHKGAFSCSGKLKSRGLSLTVTKH